MFRSDLLASMAAWWKAPGLPLWTLALAIAIEVPSAAGRRPGDPAWGLLALLPQLVMAGWVGTQRIWYLRVFRAKTMRGGELGRFTRAFTGRFVTLAFLTGIPLLLITAPLVLGHPTGWPVYLAIVTIVADTALTFVTPALAYSTQSVLEAVNIGWRVLRGEWPQCAWHALTPAMAIIILNRSLPRSRLALVPAAAVGTISWMLNLWFKGATAAYYLRERKVGDDGSAHLI